MAHAAGGTQGFVCRGRRRRKKKKKKKEEEEELYQTASSPSSSVHVGIRKNLIYTVVYILILSSNSKIISFVCARDIRKETSCLFRCLTMNGNAFIYFEDCDDDCDDSDKKRARNYSPYTCLLTKTVYIYNPPTA